MKGHGDMQEGPRHTFTRTAQAGFSEYAAFTKYWRWRYCKIIYYLDRFLSFVRFWEARSAKFNQDEKLPKSRTIGRLTCTELQKANTCLGICSYVYIFFKGLYTEVYKKWVISSSFVKQGRQSEIHAKFFALSILEGHG